MSNLQTKIIWSLNDACSYQCSYCPSKFWSGGEPPEIKDYIRVTNLIINNYNSMGRSMSWEINGGEPLDMNDIVTLLKLCRENGTWLELHTNGGKLWMDWWAIEPYVDKLHLTYHYWQNVKLIDYVIDLYKKKEKEIVLSVPMRPENFEEDLSRAEDIESRHSIFVKKQALYEHGDKHAGMFKGYTQDHLAIMSGRILKPKPVVDTPPVVQDDLVKEKKYFDTTSWHDRYKDRMNSNPSFSGMMCNAGIEILNIGHQGWVSGSQCNNEPLGNIWHENWKPPSQAQKCGMIACEYPGDRKITKFSP